MALLRHALRPAQPAALLLVVILAPLVTLASLARFFGLPLKIILLSWLFKYAYALLDTSAEGIDRPPVLSLEMLNPLELRPLMQLAICALAFGLAWWVGGVTGRAIAVAFLLVLPATAAVLGVTESVLEALNPLTLARVIRGLGVYYFALLSAALAYAAAMYGLERLSAPRLLETAIGQWLFLSFFCVIGGAIYERRHALGHEPRCSPEREAQRDERERTRRREQMLDEAYVPARIHEAGRVVEPLRRWLDAAGGAQLEDDARAFLDRAAHWNDERAYGAVSRLVIARLVAARKFSCALELFEGARRVAPGIAVVSPADLRVLIDHARATGRARLAERLAAEAGGV